MDQKKEIQRLSILFELITIYNINNIRIMINRDFRFFMKID